MSTQRPPATPTVAIARVLRSLGLTQGRGCDFRVTGEYRNGERVGTYVLTLTRHADELIAERADEIERLSAETGNSFRVTVRYVGSDRPMTTVANYGSRVRDTPPSAPEAASAPEPTPEPEAVVEPEPAPEPELPPAGSRSAKFLDLARERAWQRRRANALGWSTRQAHLVAMAATAGLSWDRNGVLRDRPRPGWSGTAVDEGRLGPLVKAGLLAISWPYGPDYKRVSVTADGIEALYLWRVYRPTPAVKDRKADRKPLRPLLGGEHARRQDLAFAEDQRQREVRREAFYAAMEELHAWEDRDERLYKAFATVNDITHRLGRHLPAGWVPTEEEIAEHRLDPEVVAELRAEAARPTPRPASPRLDAMRPLEVASLPALPDSTEQLSLFADAA